MSQTDWQTVLNHLLSKIERKTKSTLHEINGIFQRSDNKVDDKFRKNFLDILNNRVSETYERFEIDASSNDRKVCNEATSTVDIKPEPARCQSTKRKAKIEPDSNLNEVFKKHKMDYYAVSSDGSGTSNGSELEKLLFSCVHCEDEEKSNRTYRSIERVYKHWTSAHSAAKHSVKAMPFQFYVSELVKCYYCTKTGNCADIREHHKKIHPSKNPLGMVRVDDSKACALCDSADTDLVNHFRTVHDIVSKANVFNPICMSEKMVNQLQAIDIHEQHIVCERCTKVCQTRDEMEMHHLNAHNGSPMITSRYSKNIRVICWNCDKAVMANDYMQHVRSHSYALKCTECEFSSADRDEHVRHATSKHGVAKTSNKIRVELSNMLKRKYFETKILFDNGLVLVKHNLLGTTMNDSREFGCLIKEMIEVRNVKSESIVIVDDESIQEPSPIDELDKQTRLLDCIMVSGFPFDRNINDFRLFMKFCELLECPMNAGDVDKIYRLDGNQAHSIVKFKTDEPKERILQMATENTIESGHLVDLPSGVKSHGIQIDNFLTPWYRKMQRIASEAKEAGKIHCFWINEGGMAVKRTPNNPPTFVWSKDQLINYINHNS